MGGEMNEIAMQIFKPRKVFCSTFFKQTKDGISIVNPCIEDISDKFAIVKKEFLKEICLERCEIFQCHFQEFEDSDEKMLIVCNDCPYYVEAVVNDVRNRR